MARKWLIRIAVGLLSLGAFTFISLTIIGRVANRRLETELAAIREKGEPLFLTEMAPPPVPGEQNAAEPLQRASGLLVDETDEESTSMESLREDPRGCSDEAAEIARNWITRGQPALEAIEAALQRPGCRFDHDYSSAVGLLQESDFGASDFLRCADLLTTRGSLSVRDSEVPAAFDDVLHTLRLARFASSDPMLLHAMVRTACEEKALTLLHAALEREAPDQERREKLLAALDSIDIRGVFRQALLGERCFGNSMFELFPDDRDTGGFTGAMSSAGAGLQMLWIHLAPTPFIRLDQARYLSLMSEMIDLSGRPPFETEDDWEALERDLDDKPWYALLSGFSLVHMRKTHEAVEAHRARLDLARIALDLEHAKKVTGQFPDTILIPGTESKRGSIDPFSGRDYRFRRTEAGGYIIFSVGPNRGDDQGTDGRKDRYATGDITWER